MRFITFIFIITCLGCSSSNIVEINYFDNEFYSTTVIKCEEIREIMGVRSLVLNSADSISLICKIFKKYDTLIKEYSASKTIKIYYKRQEYCSDLELLLNLDKVDRIDKFVLMRFKTFIENNTDKSVLLVPYQLPDRNIK